MHSAELQLFGPLDVVCDIWCCDILHTAVVVDVNEWVGDQRRLLTFYSGRVDVFIIPWKRVWQMGDDEDKI